MRLLKLYIFISSAALIVSGCGKKAAPPPPKVRSDLVLSLYEAMDARRHEDALMKIARLREIAPSDVFLANLETRERNNAILMHAQKLIEIGDVKGACESVEEGVIKYGRHPELMKAKKKLDVANKINDILEVFKKPYDSDSLERNALTLRKLATNYKPAAIFLPVAAKEMEKAAELRVWEKKNAVDVLCSDIATLLNNKDEAQSTNVEVLYAVLAIADPKNDVLKEYRDYISGKKSAAPSVYKEENIFDSLTPSKTDAPDTEEDAMVEEKHVPAGKDVKSEESTKKEPNKESKKESKQKPGGWWKKFSF